MMRRLFMLTRSTLGGATLAICLATAAQAAPPRIEPFVKDSWSHLLTEPGARIIVFTSTDCSHCPGVIEQLGTLLAPVSSTKPKSKGLELIAIVMDQAPGEDDAALLASPHYRPVQRLMAFQGQAAALRHSVNPAWRGITPYVALVKPGQPVQWVMGMPDPAQLQVWRPAPKAPAHK